MSYIYICHIYISYIHMYLISTSSKVPWACRS